ncbi:hypothetical protein ACEE86_21690 [Proteus mirabilis]
MGKIGDKTVKKVGMFLEMLGRALPQWGLAFGNYVWVILLPLF